MPSPGQLAPTRRMAKRIRTQKPPTRLPFETDDPTTGARHEYQHRWPLWQPNQTANFPALAITSMSGLCTKPDAKAFAPHPPKTHKSRAINAEHSGALGVATKEPWKGRPAAIGRVLLRLVKGLFTLVFWFGTQY